MNFVLSTGKKDYYCILAIIVVAGLLRLVYFADYRQTSVFPLLESSDSYSYYSWARDIGSGNLLGAKAFMKWPLYAYALAFLLKLCNNNIAVIYHLQFVLGISHCLVIYYIGKRVFNRSIGFIAAIFCAGYGLFIFFESLLLYTSLSLLLNSLLFLYFLNIRNDLTSSNMFWFGVLLGVCAITQANVLVFGILAALFIAVGKSYRRSAILKCWGWFLLGLNIIIACVMVLNWRAEKDFVPIAGNLGINFYLGNNKSASGTFPLFDFIGLNQEDMFRNAAIIARQSIGDHAKTSQISYFWFKQGLNFIRTQPGRSIWLFAKKVLYAFSPQEFIHDIEYHFLSDKIRIFKILPLNLWFMFPFTLIGLLSGLRSWRRYFFLYLAVFAYAFSIILFFVTARYRLTLVPWLMLFAAYGMYILYCNLREKSYIQSIFIFIAVITLTLGFEFFVVRLSPSGAATAFENYLYQASYWEHQADYTKASQSLEKAAKIYPENQYLFFRQAVLCYRMQDTVCAETYFKRTLEINPWCVDAYYNLGVLYNQKGDYLAARKMLIAALQLDPQNPRIFFELGFMYKQTGEIVKAREAFAKSLSLLPAWQYEQRRQVEVELQAFH